MLTFCVTTLGCKVNQYEAEQIALLLRNWGLVRVAEPQSADLRIVHTCSVTTEATGKSRQHVRRALRLPVVSQRRSPNPPPRGRVVVTGCWAASNTAEAAGLAGVDAVIARHSSIAHHLRQLLSQWRAEDSKPPFPTPLGQNTIQSPPDSVRDDGWIDQAGNPAASLTGSSKPPHGDSVKQNPPSNRPDASPLPLLAGRRPGHQRALLKIQDGCDAHCTYCIVPRLRPTLWSKPLDDCIHEARNLVAAGHREIVLTGIFLGAHGYPTAIRRRQSRPVGRPPLACVVESLCTQVPGLRRLRLSSLEPSDLGDELLAALRSHPQVVPHVHLPLQSGSDAILRRMNRQYGRDDYLRMIDRVRTAFDRPAITTDIIVGFPGESADDFAQTLDVAARAGFAHVHVFAFSPRPGTAAARWADRFVPPAVVRDRMAMLRRAAGESSEDFRRQFLGHVVELLVENPTAAQRTRGGHASLQYGRCERHFAVHFAADRPLVGRSVRVCIDRVTAERTFGSLVEVEP